MKKTTFLLLVVLGFSAGLAKAADLTSKDAEILKNASIQVYHGAEYINGSIVTGARFASSAKVKDVQAFYRKAFPSWALNSEYGKWILYEGKPSGGPAAYMDKKQIMVTYNKNLPTWFSLDKNMTTEILMVVPK